MNNSVEHLHSTSSSAIRFKKLADISIPVELKNSPPIKVLFLADDQHTANVVRDHISAFLSLSKHEYVIVNPLTSEPNSHLPVVEFDAIVIHYSICIFKGMTGPFFLPEKWAKVITAFRGIKAQVIQDEYRYVNAMKFRMAELGINIVFSSLGIEILEKVYGGDVAKLITFYSCLPGYISKNYFDFHPQSIKERNLDIVYRGRNLPTHLGLHAKDKYLIGEQMLDVAKRFDLKVDISSDENARIYGDSWQEFLMSGRTTLGVEGGASIFDLAGNIEDTLTKYSNLENKISSEYICAWNQLLAANEGNVIHKTITPKLFEAIAAKTALILYPGKYSGILLPNSHYIPLEKDGSNIKDVVAKIRDEKYLQKLVDRTYEEILFRNDLSMQFYVSQIDSVLSQAMDDYSNATVWPTKCMLHQVLSEVRGEAQTIREELVSNQAQLVSTKDELTSAKGELASTKDKLTSTKDELTSTKDELTSTKDELTSTKDELTSTKDELASTRGELGSTVQELASSNDLLTSARNELVDLTVRNEKLNVLLSSEIHLVALIAKALVRRMTLLRKKIF